MSKYKLFKKMVKNSVAPDYLAIYKNILFGQYMAISYKLFGKIFNIWNCHKVELKLTKFISSVTFYS